MPDWYEVIKVAQFLGVPPWELEKQPIYWLQWGYEAWVAENQAQKILRERQERQAKHKRH